MATGSFALALAADPLQDTSNPELGYWVRRTFISAVAPNPIVNVQLNIFVRSVKNGRRAYTSAIDTVRLFLNSTRQVIDLSSRNAAVGDFETCITEMHRSINCVRRAKKSRDLPNDISKLFKTWNPDFLRASNPDRIRKMRDCVEHVHDMVVKNPDKMPLDFPYEIQITGNKVVDELGNSVLTWDRIQVGPTSIALSELRLWLDEMNEGVRHLSNCGPESIGIPA